MSSTDYATLSNAMDRLKASTILATASVGALKKCGHTNEHDEHDENAAHELTHIRSAAVTVSFVGRQYFNYSSIVL